MRWSLFFLGAVFVVGGGFLSLATHHERESNYAQIENRFGEVLLRGNKVASERLEKQVQQADVFVQEALRKAHKKESVDPSLLDVGAPRFILSSEHKVRSPDFFIDEELLGLVHKALKSNDRISLATTGDKHYLLFTSRGKSSDPSIAVYELETFFGFLRTADSTSHWLISRNAQILYHSETRFVGADASNIRPVADALHILGQGRSSAQVSSFVNLESSDALAATATIPSLGIVLGSEWSHFSAQLDRSGEFINFISLAFLAIGFFVLGFSLRNRQGEARETIRFDEHRLDADALEYLESARKSAELATGLVTEKEGIIQQLERSLSQELWRKKEAIWREETTMLFLERALKAQNGKQVWRSLAELIADRLPGASVVVYRYSHTSFSLVPEFSIGLDSIEESGKRYLDDARIFVGRLSELEHVGETQAFQNWDRQRKRYMQIHDVQIQFLPLGEGISNRGCLAVLLERSLNENSVSQETWNFFQLLIRYASWLYDTRQPLLQSKNEKRDGATLASSPDETRNKPARA